MKTPLQELLEHLETWMLDDKYIQDNPLSYEEYMVLHANQMVQIKEHFVGLCESLLEKEKEVIMDAVKYGCSDWGSSKDAEHYYNETFNTKEK